MKLKPLSKLLSVALFLFTSTLLFAQNGVEIDVQQEETVEEFQPVEQPKKEMGYETFSRVLIYLGLLAGMGWLLLQLMRKGRFGVPGIKKGSQLQIIETQVLGNKQYLIVVQYGTERILVGVGPGMINKLSDLKPGEPLKTTTPNPKKAFETTP